MYARKHGQRPIYACGKYMASGGSDCNNNTVDGEAILRFTLDTLSELTERLCARDKLRQKLIERARREQPENPLKSHYETERLRLQKVVGELRRHMEAARRNLAIEENPDHREAIREEYDRIKDELATGENQLAALPLSSATDRRTPEAEVEAAMTLFDDIRRIGSDPAARAEVLTLVQRLQLWIGLRFVECIKGKKRRVRRLAGGVLTFGEMPTPDSPPDSASELIVADRVDPGSRPRSVACKNPVNTLDAEKTSGNGTPMPEVHICEARPQEGVSFTKDNRGDRI